MTESADTISTLFLPTNLRFEQPMFERSEYLQKVLSMALALINAKHNEYFIFIERIMKPIMTKLFEIGETPLPSKEIIERFFISLFANHIVMIRVRRFCDPETYSQTETINHNYIDLNVNWITQADLSFHNERNISKDNIANRLESRIHELMGCVKLIHELLHTFTHKILEFEFSIRQQVVLSDTGVKLEDTPKQLGSNIRYGVGSQPKGILVGDMGFAFEECLFGLPAHLLMVFANHSNFMKTIQYYTTVKIYFEFASSVEHRQSQYEEEEYVRMFKRLKSEPPIDLIGSIKYSFVKKSFKSENLMYQYIHLVCRTLEKYLDNNIEPSERPSGLDIFDVFLLDENSLIEEGTPTEVSLTSIDITRGAHKFGDLAESSTHDDDDEKEEDDTTYYRKRDLFEPPHLCS